MKRLKARSSPSKRVKIAKKSALRVSTTKIVVTAKHKEIDPVDSVVAIDISKAIQKRGKGKPPLTQQPPWKD
jgi:hypothetical protein